jgi:hypothetical protein
MLAMSGPLSLSYVNSRSCFFGGRLNCEHFLSCGSLGQNLIPTARFFARSEDWREIAVLFLSRFHVYLQAVQGAELSVEETELFECVFAAEEVDVAPVASLFA